MPVGVDVGGTFTDLVAWDGATLRTAKLPTTDNQADAVIIGVAGLPEGDVVHGTTVATNALLERTGARVALITDPGLEDLIEIGRQDRPSLYDSFADRPEPLVPRSLRLSKPDRSALQGVEAVAVVLKDAYRDPTRERRIAAELRGYDVSLSSEVSPEFREFERASTTVLNAYLRQRVASYLSNLEARLGPRTVSVMQSSGGLAPAGKAAHQAVSILLSGPAGGVMAAAALAAALGHRRVISFDMGGTSTDVCRIEEATPQVAHRRKVGGYPCSVPAVGVHTIGAGGGSIAWVDSGGALRVGPRSAGARPGPACYGGGGKEPTVTDANAVMGRIGDELAGGLRLDRPAAMVAIAPLAEQLGIAPTLAALGIAKVVEAHMEGAIRVVSVEEGADPRQAHLYAFGGAGALHATSLARRLEMLSVIVPPLPGVFAALGLLLSPPRHDRARTVLLDRDVGLEGVCRQVADEARRVLAGTAVWSVDVRYRGQSHETSVDYAPAEGWAMLVDRFHETHRRRFGFARPEAPVEVVTVRATVTGQPVLRWSELPEHTPVGVARLGSRTMLTADGQVTGERWWRPALPVGAEVVGPAVIEEPTATCYLGPAERLVVHPSGALEITW